MENQQFVKLQEIILDKNIDRIVPFISDNDYLIASYQYDKDTQSKSGDIVHIQITQDKKLSVINKLADLDYGILSMKKENQSQYSLGCSDGSVRILDIGQENKMLEKSKYSNKESVCLMHDTSKSKVSAGMESGSLEIYDKEQQKLLQTFEKLHEFHIWFTLINENDIVYSCSDDCTFKKLDLRQADPIIYTNKKSNAGVTCLYPQNDFLILTGSYDGYLKLWDERKITQSLEELNTHGKSIWDLKFNSNETSKIVFNISAIYDGYLFAKCQNDQKTDKFDITKPGNLSSLELIPYQNHQSICYASEFIPQSNLVLTSSFYDNCLQLIEIKDPQ